MTLITHANARQAKLSIIAENYTAEQYATVAIGCPQQTLVNYYVTMLNMTDSQSDTVENRTEEMRGNILTRV